MSEIIIKRIYDQPTPTDGFRILVDRIWPRGVTRSAAAIDLWAKDLAPSTELRKWFNHDPAKWETFKQKYRDELKEHHDLLTDILVQRAGRRMTLVFAARDREHNQAVVLRDVIQNLTLKS